MIPKNRPSLSKSLLFSALILRLLFSALFFHPDIKSQHFHAQFLGRGITDIYSHLAANQKNLPYRDTFNYPPLTYYFLGAWNIVAKGMLGGQLTDWLADWGPLGYFHPHTFEIMLVLKFPYLVLDFLIGFLLLKIYTHSESHSALLAFWFFNPVSLYAVYMLSQFDIACAALTVLSLLFVKDKKFFAAAVCLGLGTMLKSYPVLLLPFVLFRISTGRQLSAVIFGFLLSALLPLLPVIVSSDFYYTMSHSNLMQRIFAAGIDLGNGQNIPLYVLTYTVTLWMSWNRKTDFYLLPEFLTTTLSVLLLSHFHAQWAVWSLPFVALLFASLGRRSLPLFMIAALGYFLTNFLVFDKYVLLGLFSAINPLAIAFPEISELVRPFVDPDLLQSLAHTVLSGTGAWIIYLSWKNQGILKK